MSEKKSEWSDVGQILMSKAGNLYMKITDPSRLEKDSIVMIEKPRVKFDRLLEFGAIDEAEHQKETIRFEDGGDLAFVRYYLKMGPPKDD